MGEELNYTTARKSGRYKAFNILSPGPLVNTGKKWETSPHTLKKGAKYLSFVRCDEESSYDKICNSF